MQKLLLFKGGELKNCARVFLTKSCQVEVEINLI